MTEPKSDYPKCFSCGVQLPQNAKICYNCGIKCPDGSCEV